MSQENVETMKEVFAALASEDWVAVQGFFAPDAEIHDFDIPDAGVYRGPNAFFDWIAQWDAAWETWEVEDVRFHSAGDKRVVVQLTVRARGRGSGLELKRRDAIVYTLRDAKIVRLEYFNENQKGPALEAAGLRG